jgi:hypothetical protein
MLGVIMAMIVFASENGCHDAMGLVSLKGVEWRFAD